MSDKKTTYEYGPEAIKTVQVFAAQAVMVAELTGVPLAHLAHYLQYWAQRQDGFEQVVETLRGKGTTEAMSRARGLTPEDTMEAWRAEVVIERSAALAILDDIMITAETFDPTYRTPYVRTIGK